MTPCRARAAGRRRTQPPTLAGPGTGPDGRREGNGRPGRTGLRTPPSGLPDPGGRRRTVAKPDGADNSSAGTGGRHCRGTEQPETGQNGPKTRVPLASTAAARSATSTPLTCAIVRIVNGTRKLALGRPRYGTGVRNG